MSVRSYGLNRLRRVLADARLRRLRRDATVGSGVRLHRTAEVRGHLGGLALGDRALVGRLATLRIESPTSRLVVGRASSIRDYAIVRTQQGSVTIGDHVSVHPFCLIHGEGGITIGDDVRIGPRVTILSSTHVFEDPDVPVRLQGTPPLPVHIGDDVWVGTGAVILGGVTVGRGAVIGAGAVVNHDVPAMAIVAGVPARQVGTRGRAVEATPLP